MSQSMYSVLWLGDGYNRLEYPQRTSNPLKAREPEICSLRYKGWGIMEKRWGEMREIIDAEKGLKVFSYRPQPLLQ